MRSIARRARLADGTIYLYFPGKRDLLLAAWERAALTPMLSVLEGAVAADSDEEFLSMIMSERLETLKRHDRFVRLVLQQADIDPVLRRAFQHRLAAIKAVVGERLRRGIADGRFRTIAVPIVVRAIAAMMLGVVLFERLDPDPLFDRHSCSAVAAELARLVVQGLALREPGAAS
jgi:AcrR family transcriptional regulator